MRRLLLVALAALIAGAPAFAQTAKDKADASKAKTSSAQTSSAKASKPKGSSQDAAKAKGGAKTSSAKASDKIPARGAAKNGPKNGSGAKDHAKSGQSSKSAAAKAPAKGSAPKAAPRIPPAALAPAAGAAGHALASAAPASLPSADTTISEGDLAAVKQALGLVRRARQSEASSLQASIQDPTARKLIEWAILRSDENGANASRYLNFIRSNPNWATVRMFRRRAENQLYSEASGVDAVRAFFASSPPTTPKGRLALARALLAAGDRAGAAAQVKEAWRNDDFGGDLETRALETFGDIITRADHKARMDRRLYAEDADAALRSAKRLGPTENAIAKFRVAVINRDDKAAALWDALPAEARRDAGALFSRLVFLRRKDRIAEAAALMLSAPREPGALIDLDEWWVERRLLARKLLDADDPANAYQVVRDATPPTRENYRAEHQFTAGWIALRFLDKPSVALGHFARVGQGTSNPITLARGSYWQGRALEAQGRQGDARGHYEAASRHPTAYYGQIARGRLGVTDVGLRRPPHPTGAQLHAIRNLDIVRAVEILYGIGERDFVHPMVADLADRVVDVGALVVIAEIAQKNADARSLLLIGKAVLARGYTFDQYAFPTVGVPAYATVGPQVDRSVVYAIVRQESAFNQGTVSSANALGLMQVTPAAGRYVAKKFSVAFDQRRLLSDPVYNAQMGSAELGDLLKDYRGSYILSFAAYNAGRGRVSEWIRRFGDPRDGAVDPIDWVERIPFSETRNYVQRVMENMQIYRARFNQSGGLMIEADLRRGGG